MVTEMSEQKITFVGDIMCEPLLLKAACKGKGIFDFDGVFANVKELFDESDFVVGNLETPLAGEDAEYTKSLFSFNAPDSFADAIKKAGIDLVCTANNHCFDRGIDGMLRTQHVLKEKDIPYIGTSLKEDERNSIHVADIGGTKVAFVSYTYGTNYAANKVVLADNRMNLVNLLRPQTERYFIPRPRSKKRILVRIFNKILSYLPEEQRYSIKKMLHMKYNEAHEDDNLKPDTAALYIERMQHDIRQAKKLADIVVFYPHVGGQFNANPGAFTQFVFEKALDANCDAIIASHAHVIQKAIIHKNVPCFFSIGNFSMSPNSVYLLHENLPEYGLAVHLYVRNKSITKTTFTILKIIEGNEMLTVYPVDKLFSESGDTALKQALKNDVARLYAVVTGQACQEIEICREYEF